ncbi:hypothetical protein [Nocardia sp. NBC_01327]|uniref:hypothetical protein n=1 Tax=Nocardia sp. NBC_01327 TaxID=2903593 RepID=UPI002E0F16F0|nr:hypothetical protein OG326_23585 [Nocardia sp. NBC_01327]
MSFNLSCMYCGGAIAVCEKHWTIDGNIVEVVGATSTGYRHIEGPDSPRDHGAYPGDEVNRRSLSDQPPRTAQIRRGPTGRR